MTEGRMAWENMGREEFLLKLGNRIPNNQQKLLETSAGR